MARSSGDFMGDFIVGDETSTGWQVKDEATGSLLSLVGATNGTVYVRKQGGGKLITITPTMGGALATITFKPGDEADIEPDLNESTKFDAWAEFDLGGRHYNVPRDGADYFKLTKLR